MSDNLLLDFEPYCSEANAKRELNLGGAVHITDTRLYVNKMPNGQQFYEGNHAYCEADYSKWYDAGGNNVIARFHYDENKFISLAPTEYKGCVGEYSLYALDHPRTRDTYALNAAQNELGFRSAEGLVIQSAFLYRVKNGDDDFRTLKNILEYSEGKINIAKFKGASIAAFNPIKNYARAGRDEKGNDIGGGGNFFVNFESTKDLLLRLNEFAPIKGMRDNQSSWSYYLQGVPLGRFINSFGDIIPSLKDEVKDYGGIKNWSSEKGIGEYHMPQNAKEGMRAYEFWWSLDFSSKKYCLAEKLSLFIARFFGCYEQTKKEMDELKKENLIVPKEKEPWDGEDPGKKDTHKKQYEKINPADVASSTKSGGKSSGAFRTDGWRALNKTDKKGIYDNYIKPEYSKQGNNHFVKFKLKPAADNLAADEKAFLQRWADERGRGKASEFSEAETYEAFSGEKLAEAPALNYMKIKNILGASCEGARQITLKLASAPKYFAYGSVYGSDMAKYLGRILNDNGIPAKIGENEISFYYGGKININGTTLKPVEQDCEYMIWWEEEELKKLLAMGNYSRYAIGADTSSAGADSYYDAAHPMKLAIIGASVKTKNYPSKEEGAQW